MAKWQIRELKDRRFWTWLCVEVYGKPAPKKPIKLYRKHVRFRKRRYEQNCDRGVKWVLEMIEKDRRDGAGNGGGR